MLLAVLLLGLSACGNKPAVGGQDSPAPQETTADAPEAAEEETNEEAAETAQAGTGQESAAEAAPADMTAADAAATEAAAAAEESNPKSNTLVVYFSRVGNTDFPADVDADSSASIRVDENGLMGNAGQMAAWIAEEAGCETMEIQTEDSYPVSYEETVDQAKQEQSEEVRPALKADEKTVEDYDNIYLVFPNWWGDLPMPVYSFLDAHDLAGKTVNVFVTHEGSRFSNTVGTIQGLEPDARVQEGLAVQGGSVSDEEQNIRQWVKDHQN
jgi:flavodoxin